jgi:hypothetical protein
VSGCGHTGSSTPSTGRPAEAEHWGDPSGDGGGEVEGWRRRLVESATLVNPGFFRTELLTEESANYAEPSIRDYADRAAEQRDWWEAQSGEQPGDPGKLAEALVTAASQDSPPRRFIAGADAISLAAQKVAVLQEQIDAYRDLSTSLADDEIEARVF